VGKNTQKQENCKKLHLLSWMQVNQSAQSTLPLSLPEHAAELRHEVSHVMLNY